MRRLSGAQVMSWPCPGSGELLVRMGARNRGARSRPACATQSPAFSPSPPVYAIQSPAGDHVGSEVASVSPPSRRASCVARFMIQIWEYGRPGRSDMVTL